MVAPTRWADVGMGPGDVGIGEWLADRIGMRAYDVPSVDAHAMAARSTQAFGKALALNPNLPEAHVAAVFRHEWVENDDVAAQAEFGRALALNPRDANAQLAFADTEYQLGRLDDANAAYKRAVNLDPRNVLALQGLAWLEGKRAAALLPISRHWQGGADMLANLARIEAQLGHADKAVPILDALVSSDQAARSR